ncbi:hypothetical protein [Streptomyces violascens]|uniref:hypothetical protein n=1 Tax=Streptomyces violascens TaxID=67381 RepID=UPI0036C3D7A6
MLLWVFLFALGVDDEDMVSDVAWSPVTQTVQALVFLGTAYGYTPALTGLQPNGLQLFWQLGGWLLLSGLIVTPIAQMVRDR